MKDGPSRPWRPRLRLAPQPSRQPGASRFVLAVDAVGRMTARLLGADALWSVLLAVAIVGLIGTRACGTAPEHFALGDVAREDVVARENLEISDPVLTQARRAEARAAVNDVYVYDRERADRLARGLANELVARAALPADRVDGVVQAFRAVMDAPIVGNKSLLEREAAVTVLQVPGAREERLERYDDVTEVEEARRRVREAVARAAGIDPRSAERIADLAASFVDANLTFDSEATEGRRDAAEAAVLPIQVRVPRGTVLVRAGETIGPEALERLDAAFRRPALRAGVVGWLGLVIAAAMLAFFMHRYAGYHQRHFKKVRHLHALLVMTLAATLLLARGLHWIAVEVSDRFAPPFGTPDLYAYVVPLGAGAILVALLANGRIAMIYACFAGLLFGALHGWDAHLTLWAVLTQWAGVYAITTYRERAALLRAGLVVGGAGALAAIAAEAIRRTADPVPLSHALYGALLAFLGGAIGVGLLVSFTLPLFESLFNVLTDIRLLELSNVSNPLLSQLALKAPGTYNHSMIVGTLAEEAAKAIGANSLFCRVAAFYHDIGKIRKPEYYVENQRGANPHDRLSPSMSALIVAAHVKDGIKLAREGRLPEQIVDIIPQHHGTRRMSYFYEKARKLLDPALGGISEDDFRYPGPKPQTREAAIFMLADGIEAAARTIDDPTPSRLRELIHKISSAIVLDGQLDECDLTFADLEKIEQAFLRALTSMYHHRVDYPGFDFGRPRGSADGRTARVGS